MCWFDGFCYSTIILLAVVAWFFFGEKHLGKINPETLCNHIEMAELRIYKQQRVALDGEIIFVSFFSSSKEIVYCNFADHFYNILTYGLFWQ